MIIDFEELNKKIETIEEQMQDLNAVEKDLLIRMLQRRREREAQTLQTKDAMGRILPGWATKMLNRKDGDDTLE